MPLARRTRSPIDIAMCGLRDEAHTGKFLGRDYLYFHSPAAEFGLGNWCRSSCTAQSEALKRQKRSAACKHRAGKRERDRQCGCWPLAAGTKAAVRNFRVIRVKRHAHRTVTTAAGAMTMPVPRGSIHWQPGPKGARAIDGAAIAPQVGTKANRHAASLSSVSSADAQVSEDPDIGTTCAICVGWSSYVRSPGQQLSVSNWKRISQKERLSQLIRKRDRLWRKWRKSLIAGRRPRR